MMLSMLKQVHILFNSLYETRAGSREVVVSCLVCVVDSHVFSS